MPNKAYTYIYRFTGKDFDALKKDNIEVEARIIRREDTRIRLRLVKFNEIELPNNLYIGTNVIMDNTTPIAEVAEECGRNINIYDEGHSVIIDISKLNIKDEDRSRISLSYIDTDSRLYISYGTFTIAIMFTKMPDGEYRLYISESNGAVFDVGYNGNIISSIESYKITAIQKSPVG